MSGQRSYPSRCEVPQQPALVWHFYGSAEEGQVVLQSLRSAWSDPKMSDAERKARQGEIFVRLRAAAAGDLTLDEELRVVAQDPDLWEIRWNFSDSMWRLYHAEPQSHPAHLIGLNFHEKINSETAEATRAAQNVEIGVASRRFVFGTPSRWGLL